MASESSYSISSVSRAVRPLNQGVEMKRYARSLQNAYRMVAFIRNWPTALRNRLEIPSQTHDVSYYLRSGLVFCMESGRNDLQVVIDLLRDRIYEPTTDFQIQNGWTVLDLGAHKGVFSILAAMSGPDTVVHAVEPAPTNLEFLKKNLALNNIKNVNIHEAAIWTSMGEIEFTLDTSWSHALSSIEDRQNNHSDKISVQTLTLDRLVSLVGGHVDLVKIDIEGAEHAVLTSTLPHTLRCIQRLVLEYHSASGMPAEGVGAELKTFLEAQGFSCWSPMESHLVAVSNRP